MMLRQPQRIEREAGEGGEATQHADDQEDAAVWPDRARLVGQGGEQADAEAANDVDAERAPGEGGAEAVRRPGRGEITGAGAERPAEQDEYELHRNLPCRSGRTKTPLPNLGHRTRRRARCGMR